MPQRHHSALSPPTYPPTHKALPATDNPTPPRSCNMHTSSATHKPFLTISYFSATVAPTTLTRGGWRGGGPGSLVSSTFTHRPLQDTELQPALRGQRGAVGGEIRPVPSRGAGEWWYRSGARATRDGSWRRARTGRDEKGRERDGRTEMCPRHGLGSPGRMWRREIRIEDVVEVRRWQGSRKGVSYGLEMRDGAGYIYVCYLCSIISTTHESRQPLCYAHHAVTLRLDVITFPPLSFDILPRV
ncbi:hypothetical protein K461DRAFT_151754 [Myriangium duriaei CBS 260.36]|uniref:Uncharacterized protein n=1 Tax=Myriangium duriaei CBS 260.36 TaxID=1168546 RepID=A0A9P4IZF8_9PEZI|nr:hypothetical protein K461DRAFT_151754 [Myriangium duriaei CBS 260.36]